MTATATEFDAGKVKVGDVIGADCTPASQWYGRRFTVVKVNPTTFKTVEENGTQRLTIHKARASAAPGKAETTAGGATVQTMPIGRPYQAWPEGVQPGALVTYPRPIGKYPARHPFVVFREGPKNVSITPLGGGQVWKVNPRALSVVPADEAVKALAPLAAKAA